MAEIGKNILHAKAILDAGGLIGLPTETVYGLAANGLSAEAVSQIFEVKNRPHFDPLILHTHHIDAIKPYVDEIPEKALLLAHSFWPGPLTLLLKRNKKIPDLTCSGLDRAAFRIPNHPITLDLLRNLDYPLAAPSANPFGYISPTSAQHVAQQLGDKIPYILEGEISQVGIESTIIGFEGETATIYRLGGLEIEQIENIIGPVNMLPHSSSRPDAPGMLQSHYAPRKKFILGNIADLIRQYGNLKVGVLSFNKSYEGVQHSLRLTEKDNMQEAAKNLFSHMRKLDGEDIELIISETVPNEGLGKAINDRLKRASI